MREKLNLQNGSPENECPSPDRSGILSIFSLKIERYSGEQETASKINYYRLYLQFDIKTLILF
ncbi:hypothetical protein [Flavobacterium denitrificans]|uniref:hypothetical protein n=1 Tax=Flavobacterium denitrificans TaxID=281361 RepID=UPI0012F97AAD|nr:hypothetical protein [Flavobacterium denitrificans]